MATTIEGDRCLEQISFYLGRAYYSYMGMVARMLAEAGLDEHLAPGMGNVLFALFERDNQTISEIARRLKLSKSTMTGTVTRIRKAGLITIHRDSFDGRATRLKLTPLGRSLEPRYRKMAEHADQTLCRRFDAAQSESLRRLLATMIDAMREETEESE